jgi:hypothetical protein
VPKYKIPLNGYASVTISIETDETDPERIYEEAMAGGIPGICAQCSGWGASHSLEIGDEWEPEADKETGAVVVYDEAGDPVKASGGED